jgi:hypothetical protein
MVSLPGQVFQHSLFVKYLNDETKSEINQIKNPGLGYPNTLPSPSRAEEC